jgi:hypothetical protein
MLRKRVRIHLYNLHELVEPALAPFCCQADGVGGPLAPSMSADRLFQCQTYDIAALTANLPVNRSESAFAIPAILTPAETLNSTIR